MNSVIFDAWAQCGEGQWSKSKFLMNVRERHSVQRRGCRKWLFDWEMDQRFGQEVASMIRDAKLADAELTQREVRYFPGIPESEKTRQYLTLVDETQDDVHEEEIDRLYSCLDESSSGSSSDAKPKKERKGGKEAKARGLCKCSTRHRARKRKRRSKRRRRRTRRLKAAKARSPVRTTRPRS